jgi:PAS domain S-box-containing protein
MIGTDDRPVDAAELRLRAEEMARENAARAPENLQALSLEETRRTLHELRVHQIELEMQNEELRRAQAELEASRARYFDRCDLAPVGYFTLSEQGLILEANLTAGGLLGVARGALVKQSITRFILREDQDLYYRHRKRLFETDEPQVCELRMVKMDATAFWARLEATVAQDAGGAPVCHLVMSDITERKRAEEEKARLEAQLQQAQKMESVGRLAGGVAHDFNNMLGVILGHTEMALDQVEPAQPLHAALTEIRSAASRSADLTRQLMAFARRQTIAPKVLDLNETVTGMLKMLKRLIGEDVDLHWQPAADLWPVRVDPSQIDQILANLCVNARDAISGVGKMTIEMGNRTFEEGYCAAHAGFVPGEYVLLAVSDNGCGMDNETLSHLFEPFFTTKGMGQGTGLGLATIYGIVKQNHGFIDVYSQPDRGTAFKIYLPRYVGQAGQARREGAPGPLVRGQETILLVEDEPAVLKMTTMMLKRQNYTVLAAGTPGEAIALAREHAGEIHLLVTDVVMPEMNGRDLAKNLLSLYPHLKRLFMSGHTANVIAHNSVLNEGVHFIQKPFSMKDLAVKVREALGVMGREAHHDQPG